MRRNCGLRHQVPAKLTAMLLGACAILGPVRAGAGYIQQDLVSDLPGVAAITDPNLVNPWGMSSSSTSPIWVSDNGTGLATLYNGTGTPQALVVTIAPSAGSPAGTEAAPTGQVFNSNSSAFLLNPLDPSSAARFIFATEDGTISGWNGGTVSILKVDNSASGAVYKGLAIGSVGGQQFLYAANFHNGTIDVFNTNFSQTNVGGNFTDPNLPAGYAPFNVQNLNGKLYVTYARQDATGKDDVAGPGHGFVDVFDTNGSLLQRLVSMGPLNSPWGLALAPGNFGEFSNDLLVGNFGDGEIHAFDPTTGTLIGTAEDTGGNPIINEGLWGLQFGNGGNGGLLNQLFFTAGIAGPDEIEDHGLFGNLTVAAAAAVPEPGSFALLATSLAGLAWLRRRSNGYVAR